MAMVLLSGAASAMAATPPPPAAALYLSPASASVSAGQSISVDIHENSAAEPVNIAQIKLNYPADRLKLTGVTNSAVFIPISVYKDVMDNGVISLLRAAFPVSPAQPGPVGDQIIASLQFQVLATAGTMNIDFSGAQTILSAVSHANVAGTAAGAAYNIPVPVPAPPPAPAPTPQDFRAPPILKTPLQPPFSVQPTTITPKPIFEKLKARPDQLSGYFNGGFSRLGRPPPTRQPADPAPAAALLLFLLLILML